MPCARRERCISQKNQLIRCAIRQTGGREIATISNSCTIPMSNIFRKIRQSDKLFRAIFFLYID